MGRDLVGYMVKGPVHLPKEKDHEALAHLAKMRQCFVEISGAKDRTPEEYQEIWERWSDKGRRDDYWFTEFEFIFPEHLSDEDILQKFKDFWELPTARDTAFRTFGDEMVVFAGDSSWGDSPNGEGYEILRMAYCLEILEIYGVH